MTRDFEIIRYLLQTIEQSPRHQTFKASHFERYSVEKVNYHLWLLLDAGLVVGQCNHRQPFDGYFACSVNALTWVGHELLALIDDDDRFHHIKRTLKEHGLPITIDTIKKVSL